MEEEIQVKETILTFNEAMGRNDVAKLRNMMTSDFILVHMSGRRQTGEEWLNDLTTGVMVYTKQTVGEPLIKSLTQNEAIVQTDTILSASFSGARPSNWSVRSTFTLIKKADQWRVQLNEVIPN
ncbi:MAG: nuclear transport factor 2 family protein [Enterococcus sp.]